MNSTAAARSRKVIGGDPEAKRQVQSGFFASRAAASVSSLSEPDGKSVSRAEFKIHQRDTAGLSQLELYRLVDLLLRICKQRRQHISVAVFIDVRRYLFCYRVPLVLINCSACRKASGVRRWPDSMRPISLVRASPESSSIAATVRPLTSFFSTTK
jgi:hypothetical protein